MTEQDRSSPRNLPRPVVEGTPSPIDIAWMERAIEAASRGRTRPNPRVGAVALDANGRHLGTGFHRKAGEDHAEVDAIKKAQAVGSTQGGTLYVTLEPCNHHGRTPPCSEAVLAAGFRRLVVGCPDPAPKVPGSIQEGSIERLRQAGLVVDVGLLQGECEALISDFAHHFRTGMPEVILKAAVTLDGRMATRTGDSKWITGESARIEAHRMRDRADAIAVGVETVLADDPRLDVRHVAGVDPVRVVFDTHLRTPPAAKLLRGDGALLIHGPAATEERRTTLRDAGATLIEVPLAAHGHVDLAAALKALGERDFLQLLVEGGGMLHGALLDAGLAQRAAVFVAPRIIGDREARPLAAGIGATTVAEGWRLEKRAVRLLGDDVLFTGELIRDQVPSTSRAGDEGEQG